MAMKEDAPERASTSEPSFFPFHRSTLPVSRVRVWGLENMLGSG